MSNFGVGGNWHKEQKMLLNPTQMSELLQTFPGSRLLVQDFGLTGVPLQDPKDPNRVWSIQNLFAPLPRCLGGVRARCLDQKGFVSFIDQMGLEILLGLAQAGDDCPWADWVYPSPQDYNWYGFCADPLDLLDDLFLREVLLRAHWAYLPQGMELQRFVHVDTGQDVLETHILVWDGDRTTGMSPDPRMETLEARWARADKEKVQWRRL